MEPDETESAIKGELERVATEGWVETSDIKKILRSLGESHRLDLGNP